MSLCIIFFLFWGWNVTVSMWFSPACVLTSETFVLCALKVLIVWVDNGRQRVWLIVTFGNLYLSLKWDLTVALSAFFWAKLSSRSCLRSNENRDTSHTHTHTETHTHTHTDAHAHTHTHAQRQTDTHTHTVGYSRVFWSFIHLRLHQLIRISIISSVRFLFLSWMLVDVFLGIWNFLFTLSMSWNKLMCTERDACNSFSRIKLKKCLQREH